jgi:hypothetical protein
MTTLLTHDHTNVRGRVIMIHQLPHRMKIARTAVMLLIFAFI